MSGSQVMRKRGMWSWDALKGIGRAVLVAVELGMVATMNPVASGATDEAELPPLKPPRKALEVPRADGRIWPWVVGFLCIGAGVAWCYLPLRKPREQETAFERGCRELKAIGNGNGAEVEEVVCRYFTSAFPVPGPGQTVEEIEGMLASRSWWTPELAARFRALVEPVEIGKFSPGGEVPSGRISEALSLITEIERLRAGPPVMESKE